MQDAGILEAEQIEVEEQDFIDEASDQTENSARPQGEYIRSDGKRVIGRVGAPSGQQATSEEFFFTFPAGVLVEKTQIVTCESKIGGEIYTFYALVTEVYRQSRQSAMSGEADEYDGDLSFRPPFESAGFNTARASILRVEPAAMIPPRERSDVFLASDVEAQKAYEADEIENPLTVGLIKNGGSATAGQATIDLDYLLGKNGGHLNVNGAAGRGTKSSFLLFVIYMLLLLARRLESKEPSSQERPRIVPIIFNVKGQDLFHIDKPSKHYKPEKHLADWKAIGVENPQPFQNVRFYAAQGKGEIAVPFRGRTKVLPYSWSLSDIVERGLFRYLFAETDANDLNFGGLVSDVEILLGNEKIERDGESKITLNMLDGKVKNFKTLIEWADACASDAGQQRGHHQQTWKKFHRRLRKAVYESGGVLRFEDARGKPLDLVKADTSDPVVVDLNSLAGKPELQRFVVATVLRQLIQARTATTAQSGLRFVVMLDELNRFAPHGAKDSITRLIELVASEMRSQGIILLGAQQQASKISGKIMENAGIIALGKSSPMELTAPVWKGLSQSAKRKAQFLAPNEKLILQDNFLEPLHIRVPMPVWAMTPEEAATNETDETADDLKDLIQQ